MSSRLHNAGGGNICERGDRRRSCRSSKQFLGRYRICIGLSRMWSAIKDMDRMMNLQKNYAMNAPYKKALFMAFLYCRDLVKYGFVGILEYPCKRRKTEKREDEK